MRLSEWVKDPDVPLGQPVQAYRAMLEKWVEDRENGRKISLYIDAPEYIDWPALDDVRAPGEPWSQSRVRKREKGERINEWEREPSKKL